VNADGGGDSRDQQMASQATGWPFGGAWNPAAAREEVPPGYDVRDERGGGGGASLSSGLALLRAGRISLRAPLRINGVTNLRF
jgi:hypothetical protein